MRYAFLLLFAAICTACSDDSVTPEEEILLFSRAGLVDSVYSDNGFGAASIKKFQNFSAGSDSLRVKLSYAGRTSYDFSPFILSYQSGETLLRLDNLGGSFYDNSSYVTLDTIIKNISSSDSVRINLNCSNGSALTGPVWFAVRDLEVYTH